jgi:hypothetical protein
VLGIHAVLVIFVKTQQHKVLTVPLQNVAP